VAIQKEAAEKKLSEAESISGYHREVPLLLGNEYKCSE